MSLFYYKSLLTLSPYLMQMHKSKATLTLSPCLRGTKIANPREQSQARLSYAEQEQFGQSQPKRRGLLTAPYSLLLIPCSLANRTDRVPVVAIVAVPDHAVRIEAHVVGAVRTVGVERTRPVVAVRPSIVKRAFVQVTRSGQEN